MGQQTCGAAKLSRPQREALLALLAYTERHERSALNITVAGRVAAPLCMLRPGGRRTNAQSAAFSRALRRLGPVASLRGVTASTSRRPGRAAPGLSLPGLVPRTPRSPTPAGKSPNG